MALSVKNPPTMQETWVLSLGWDDPLEEEMATDSSILTGVLILTVLRRILRTKEPGGL